MGDTLVVVGRVPNTDAHVTFAFKHNCSTEEQHELTADVELRLSPFLPLECTINPDMIKVGKQNELDAYQVELVDEEARSLFSKFWHTHQRRQEGHELFPFNLHVTLNSDQKREQMALLVDTGGSFEVEHILIRELESKKAVAEFVALSQRVIRGASLYYPREYLD